MSLVLITPPAEALISLDEARAHLKLDAVGGIHPDDNLVKALIAAATGELDGRDGWLNRALVTQKWRFTFDEFPCRKIRIPLAPLRSVTKLEYVAADGTVTTLSDTLYRVLTGETPGIVEPVYNGSWPATRCETGAVRIEFEAGYGTASQVPEIIKAYAKLKLGQYYQNREAVIVGPNVTEQPHIKHMLESFRVRSNYP